MAHWLSSVNNLLEKLDDQVENVRDALTEQRDSDEDEEEYFSSEEEDDDAEDDDNEEEEIDLMGEKEEGSKPALFAPNPLSEEIMPMTSTDDAPPSPQQASNDPIRPKPTDPTTQPEDVPKPKDTPVSPPLQPPKNKKPATPIPASTAKAPPKLDGSKQGQMSIETTSPQKGAKPPVPLPPPAPATPENLQSKTKGEIPPASKTSEGSGQRKTAIGKSGLPPSSNPTKNTMQTKPPANSNRRQAQPSAPSPKQQQQQQQNAKQLPQQPPNAKGARTSPATSPPPGKAGGLNTNNKQQVLAELDRLRKHVTTLQQDLSSAQTQIKSQQKDYSAVVQSKQQLLSEMKPMRKQIVNLQQELNSANKEINAQRKELDSAATIVERERQELKEEKEDMQEDHEEEIDNLKADYEEKISNLKARHRQQLDDMKQQLSQEKAERRQEGGDLNQDLEEALQREREALQELSNLKEEKSSLGTKVEKLTMQQESLQEKLESALHSQTAATERQLQAETALDDALEQHKRQLKQRQVREAELERTIAEMGTALTTSSSVAAAAAATANGGSTATASGAQKNGEKASYYKEQWELATEEVETLKGQLNLETQRSEALRRELGEINEERTNEATASQERQRQHDRKLEEQSATIARLESTLRELQPNQDVTSTSGSSAGVRESNAAVVQSLQRQLEESKEQMKRISEQLLRQQGMTDVHKSEILALKGRLQAANARAEEAEKTAFQSTAAGTNGGGVGGYQMKRRVKGRGGLGSPGGRSVTVRSIRTALNMGPGTSMEGLGKTIDAIDSWMIETGAILRHEPIARLGFFLYFSILHLWCFCLVAFHVSESSSGAGRSGPSSLRGAAVNAASSGQ